MSGGFITEAIFPFRGETGCDSKYLRYWVEVQLH
jgi:hypothetical protein